MTCRFCRRAALRNFTVCETCLHAVIAGAFGSQDSRPDGSAAPLRFPARAAVLAAEGPAAAGSRSR